MSEEVTPVTSYTMFFAFVGVLIVTFGIAFFGAWISEAGLSKLIPAQESTATLTVTNDYGKVDTVFSMVASSNTDFWGLTLGQKVLFILWLIATALILSAIIIWVLKATFPKCKPPYEDDDEPDEKAETPWYVTAGVVAAVVGGLYMLYKKYRRTG